MNVAGQATDLQQVQLEPLNLQLSLPVTASVSSTHQKVHVDFSPTGRQLRTCTLEVTGTAFSNADFPRRTRLANGAVLHYRVDTFEGGSGGEEHTLMGVLLMPTANYAVQSHDQAEYPARPDPRFCLKYLSSLKQVSVQKESND